MKYYVKALIISLIIVPTFAQSLRRLETPTKTQKTKTFYLERFYYEDFIYSQGRKTQLGDQVELESSLIYRYSENTFGRLRFETIPEDNRIDNKTSRFQLLAGHKYKDVEFALDFELETNESENGGTTLGFNVDSEYTMLRWKMTDTFFFTFFPFNFDGEVGQEFNTWDVTRIYYIEGAPTTITFEQGTNSIVEKTIPGVDLRIITPQGFEAYVGGGVASYLYPTNSNYDIVSNRSATRWERRSDVGYKAGFLFTQPNMRFRIEYVGHSKADETGSLLDSAASLYYIQRFQAANPVIVEFEATGSKAGGSPWRISRSTGWFEINDNPVFDPVYADLFRQPQDWIGQKDFAISARVGVEYKDDRTFYLLARYQGEHFIFRDEESAHVLRTADESQSHGGLLRGGLGTILRYGNFSVNPELEYRIAKNPVFSNSADVNGAQRSQRLIANFRKTDVLLTMFLTYDFGGSINLQP